MLLQLFGSFVAQVDGQPLPPLRSRKGHWLLALLALQRDGAMERARLAGLLWPESAHAQALYNLRRALGELREVMGSEAQRLSSPNAYTLALDLAGAQVDALAFDAALARGDEASLECAVELYRGPLLEQCDEAWVLQERLPREEAYLAALESLAAHAMGHGDPGAALQRLHAVVALDPFREAAQQALLQALIATGDTIGALLAYRAFRLRLHQELRTEPSPETKAIFHQLRAQARRRPGGRAAGETEQRSSGPTGRSTGRSLAAPAAPRRLPRPISQFVGRETALHAVEACLESARLVTLTGPGGVGKTRLAIQVADAIADDHVDGVWFVDLTRLSDAALVPQTVASVLAVPEPPDRPLTETLAEFLRAKQLLLVLDNCEHLLAACAELVETLLSSSPELRVLATSRQSLGLTGEVAWQLPGLSVPPVLKTPDPTPEALLQFEAVRLLVERGMAANPLFSLTERNARAVREICRRLDGIPLALELAAARLKALSAEEVAARLDDRFRLLTGGSRTAPRRQQTLRATLDWSYELLSPPQRLLLQRLSVFAGGFSLKAVECVCQEEGLDLLTQLVGQSLVMVEDSTERSQGSGPSLWQVPPMDEEGETRYRLLETVRQYALERLREEPARSGEREEERVRRCHLEFYLGLAEEAGPHMWGPEQGRWLGRLEIELDNLRTALDWAAGTHEVGGRDPARALRLAVELATFFIQRGYLTEGRQRLDAVLHQAGPARRSYKGAWVLIHLGHLAFRLDDFPAARALYEESLAIHRELGDRWSIAHALAGLGQVARRQTEYAEARAMHEESLALRRELGDQSGIAQSLIGLGDTLREQGDDPSAWAFYYEEALVIRQELGDRTGVADALGDLANAAWRQGDYAKARRHREESLALWRSMGSLIAVIHALGALGHLARDQGEYEDARAFYTESLSLRRELGDPFTLVQALEDFAELAASEGRWARMTRLLGATDSLRERMGHALQSRERGEYDRYLDSARGALGEAAAAAEREAGRACSLEQAIDLALLPAAL
jgi:predicted ATPase/DNA-binding SARP family transcriptional activator